MDELASGGEVLLSSRELVRGSGESGSLPLALNSIPSMVVAKSYLLWPWSSSQMLEGRDPTMAEFERGQVVQLILTKVVFAYKKPLVVTPRWAR